MSGRFVVAGEGNTRFVTVVKSLWASVQGNPVEQRVVEKPVEATTIEPAKPATRAMRYDAALE